MLKIQKVREDHELTLKKLLKIIHKELTQWRPSWLLQSVYKLLDLGRDSTADRDP